MTYKFKENITHSEYEKFIKKRTDISYMQEDNWAKAKNIKKTLLVGIEDKSGICAVAHILINKIKGGKQLLIPNGYILDFTNKGLLDFMTDNIKKLAKKYRAYIVDIYPNITNRNMNYDDIHNNLISLNYKYKKEYIDNTDNIIIPLKKNNKKIAKNELKRKYSNEDFYLKRGIYFEVTNNLENVKRIKELVNKPYFNENTVKGLIKNYNNRINMLFAKLDLVYYLNFLRENNGSNDEINKISELLTISDEIDIGCALIIEPYKYGDCELIYNVEKESFENLDILNGLLYETMKISNKKNYENIKISNLNLDCDKIIKKYNGYCIEYIGHYSIVINKFKYFFNKPIIIRKR